MSRNISKIIGIGWNYANHIKELNYLASLKPQQIPLFFLKPPSSVTTEVIELPKGVNVHYEIELGVYIGKDGKNIDERDAMDHVKGYCLALDMTARNLQAQAKQNGQPWTQSKGFDTFCPISNFIPKSEIQDPQALRLELALSCPSKKDGNPRIVQNGSTRDMIHPVSQLIAYLSTIMTLKDGDLILTGTPEGVGQVKDGQVLIGRLYDESRISTLVTEMSFSAIDRGY